MSDASRTLLPASQNGPQIRFVDADLSSPASQPSRLRNRIKGHRVVKAGSLIPHELNFRGHSQAQQDILKELYKEVGFARSLLAYELPDGQLKLIDGHMRRDIDPDQDVTVEILDVDCNEAKILLASLDPITGLATHNDRAFNALMSQVGMVSDAAIRMMVELAPQIDAIYQPNLAPVASQSQVTQQDIESAKKAQDEKIQPTRVLWPTQCPKCQYEFFVDPNQKMAS